ncbi:MULTISPECIES: antibiotic biosynthesis monooxygenase [Pseudonocardia]|uniref:putative quinol monooxygenase n=1 Tax=Pseudonocardia TaxID=1847 RepID=UPI001E383A27|nr:antibiotic biosynthesis monooxygenase [Pseudonocardia terrae]MCE3551149.1 antibiotic biosynthesis monooxygenase [Pseudonocardia terrae]
MAESVVVVATVVPKPGREAETEAAFLAAVAATHAQDEGCELYALHRSVRGPDGFVVIEKWASTEALAAHGAGAAFTALSARFEDLLAEPLGVTVMAPIPAGDEKLGLL